MWSSHLAVSAADSHWFLITPRQQTEGRLTLSHQASPSWFSDTELWPSVRGLDQQDDLWNCSASLGSYQLPRTWVPGKHKCAVCSHNFPVGKGCLVRHGKSGPIPSVYSEINKAIGFLKATGKFTCNHSIGIGWHYTLPNRRHSNTFSPVLFISIFLMHVKHIFMVDHLIGRQTTNLSPPPLPPPPSL